MLLLHVEPRDCEWIVRRDGARAPLSEHADAGEATRAACVRAYTMSADASVLVHDRYHRVREERLGSARGRQDDLEAGGSRTREPEAAAVGLHQRARQR